jgi:hypothetical protein
MNDDLTPTKIIAKCDRCGRTREIPTGILLAYNGVELKRTAYSDGAVTLYTALDCDPDCRTAK